MGMALLLHSDETLAMSPARKPVPPQKRGPASPDKSRHAEHHEHHPVAAPAVHPPHHPQKKAVLTPRHNPHTGPENKALNQDHGTHEDRPRPGKIAKKGDPDRSKKMKQ
jgi:hypothetical protein